MFCKSSETQSVPFELSAEGVKSVPMKTVPSRRSTKAQPAEGEGDFPSYIDEKLLSLRAEREARCKTFTIPKLITTRRSILLV